MAQQVNYTTPGPTTQETTGGVSALVVALVIIGLLLFGYLLFAGRDGGNGAPDVNIRTEQQPGGAVTDDQNGTGTDNDRTDTGSEPIQ